MVNFDDLLRSSPSEMTKAITTPAEADGLFASTSHVQVRDWNAADFASIFVRFRPILEAQAARYLRDHNQREEVVQDAFLYLMTALPELDSEVGVLRFLKWKVKMLSYDVLRLRQKAPINLSDEDIDHHQTGDGLDPADQLVRAEDAALVAAALARLNESQQKALVGSLIEGRDHKEMAERLSLSENAFRQLLHRARSSMKKAIMQEAQMRGVDFAQLVSSAARTAVRIGPKVGSMLLALVLGVATLSPLLVGSDLYVRAGSNGSELFIAAPEPRPLATESSEPGESSIRPETGVNAGVDAPKEEPVGATSSEPEDLLESSDIAISAASSELESGFAAIESAADDEFRFLLQNETANTILQASTYASEDLGLSIAKTGSIHAETPEGFHLELFQSPDGTDFTLSLTLGLNSDQRVVLYPLAVASDFERLDEERTLVHLAATDFVLGDLDGGFGSVSTKLSHEFGQFYFTVRLVLDAQNVPSSIQTKWVNRT